MSDPLAEWRAAIESLHDFVTDPDGQRDKLDALAETACRMGQVSREDVWEMADIVESARVCALLEHEEAYRIGLFGDHRLEPEGEQTYIGGKWKF